jgi:hypothetical protein
MSYSQEFKECALLILLSDHLGCLHVGLALNSTVRVALLCSHTQSDGGHRIVDANACNVEEHVKGNIVVYSYVHYHKVVEEVAI